MARQLQKAAVRVLSEQTCRRFYPVQISSRMLCAGFPQGGVDSCSVSGAFSVAPAGLKACDTAVIWTQGLAALEDPRVPGTLLSRAPERWFLTWDLGFNSGPQACVTRAPD